MDFVKYQHVERFGSEEVEDIERGTCYIFPKIDGTNGSVWNDNGAIRCASRKRELQEGYDNQGFKDYVLNNQNIIDFLKAYPNLRLYGEWLVPHSLKTYRDDAWRRFYVFDVTEETDELFTYLPYYLYKPMLEKFGVDYIPLLREAHNPTYEQLVKMMEANTFLIKDGEGAGEGIVIKNYNYKNKYGRVKWAKMVRSEFKEVHSKTMGAPVVEGALLIEERIVDQFLTAAMVEKEYEKIKEERGGWSSKYIPQLLGTVYHAFITEEIWNILKEFKSPKIDFKRLNKMAIEKIKKIKPELF